MPSVTLLAAASAPPTTCAGTPTRPFPTPCTNPSTPPSCAPVSGLVTMPVTPRKTDFPNVTPPSTKPWRTLDTSERSRAEGPAPPAAGGAPEMAVVTLAPTAKSFVAVPRTP
jgi:hypothetical protein